MTKQIDLEAGSYDMCEPESKKTSFNRASGSGKQSSVGSKKPLEEFEEENKHVMVSMVNFSFKNGQLMDLLSE